MAAFTLAHLSDPHLPPMPVPRLRDLAGKRAFGYVNWRRNRQDVHRRDVLDALVSDLRAQSPDQIAVTGDLVNIALEAEFAPARAWLESVGTPDRVTVIPGNHDTYVRVTQHRFAESWDNYLHGDVASGDGVTFPSLRRRGPLALISTSTAVPTPPLMATGRLGRSQLDALERMLAGLEAEQVFRVLLIHHPLRSDSHIKRLTDSAALIALLKRHGVELILHGHDHVHSTIWIDGPQGKIPVVGVPSASAVAHGRYPAAAYNLFSIARDGGAWRCEQTVRGIDENRRVREIRQTRLI
ncbi:metallophosphoesterase [Bradyrhizobium sediminis]|uniref:Metallophosphoesterase n=1 Tax=Bradyrhizobium sediminis TaxID=2840469 RepID=A0A975NWU1_9BRAD|nr:metallophosphoesterase [Bradyrhizobium sediminis]QWG22430.1 metallophosphoesterase [Bradyrhizobium sediminis]